MRLCPSCGNRYSDDTLKFCLQDGTPLYSARDGEMPTAMLSEVDTADARRRVSAPTDQSGWRQGQNAFVTTPERKPRSNTAVAVVLTAFGMLLLFGVGGIAFWLYSRNAQSEVVINTDRKSTANVNTAVNSTPTPTAKTTPSPSKTPTPPPVDGNSSSSTVADSQTRAEVIGRLDSWKSQSESLDLDAYMTHYAATVDYYNKSGASSAFVRRDKQRAFTRFDSISVNLTNISVTTSDGGQTAMAVFDKEWDFRGNRNSSGKVQQMIRFAKVGGQWLITAEKDLKVYYKR